jgi:predicted nucleic acid-binding protein
VIILDTNVVSAMMLDPPEPAVVRLLDRRAPESIWTTSVTLFEIQDGIERLPPSRKRSQLEQRFQRALDQVFENRLLAFDGEAAYSAAKLSAGRKRRGTPVETRDTMIAGIVISRRAEFATRNVRHFRDLGLLVIDPWSA